MVGTVINCGGSVEEFVHGFVFRNQFWTTTHHDSAYLQAPTFVYAVTVCWSEPLCADCNLCVEMLKVQFCACSRRVCEKRFNVLAAYLRQTECNCSLVIWCWEWVIEAASKTVQSHQTVIHSASFVRWSVLVNRLHCVWNLSGQSAPREPSRAEWRN